MPAQYSLSELGQMRWPVLAPAAAGAAEPHVALDRPVCVVGARVLVHFPLASQEVSKAHALIVHEADGVYIRDLASKNRTFVNDVPVREKRLAAGDTVRFGPFKYLCRQGFDGSGESQHIPAAELHLEPDGLASRQIVSLERQTFLIGSRDGCDLYLRGAEVALAHAVLFVKDGRRYLRDLSSGTGTFVEDRRIREIELTHDVQIRIGEYRLQYHPVGQANVDAVFVADITEEDEDALTAQSTDRIPLPWDDLEDEVAMSDQNV